MTTENRPLWAPWRIEFIRSRKEPGCFLCGNRIEGESPREDELIVARYSLCFVILNRFPYNSGHLLVSPYRHVGELTGLEKEERHQIMDVCVDATKALDLLMRPAAYNIGFNLGTAAGAGVAEHLHLHVVPRWNGDTNFMPVLSDTRVVPETLVKTAEMVRGVWEKS